MGIAHSKLLRCDDLNCRMKMFTLYEKRISKKNNKIMPDIDGELTYSTNLPENSTPEALSGRRKNDRISATNRIRDRKDREEHDHISRFSATEELKAREEKKIKEVVSNAKGSNSTMQDQQVTADSHDEVYGYASAGCIQQEMLSRKENTESNRNQDVGADVGEDIQTPTTNPSALSEEDNHAYLRNDEHPYRNGQSTMTSIIKNNFDPEFKREFIRYGTYMSFPNDLDKPFPTRLAQAGFISTQNGDEVICYTCGFRKSGWNSLMDPFRIHVYLNRRCKFLTNNKEVNIPLHSSTDVESRIAKAFRDIAIGGNESNDTIDTHKETRRDNNALTNVLPSAEVVSTYDVSEQNSRAGSTSGNHRNAGNTSSEFTNPSGRQNIGKDTPYTSNYSRSSATRGVDQAVGADVPDTMPVELARQMETLSNVRNETTRRSVLPKYPDYELLRARIESFSNCQTIAVAVELLAESGLFYAGHSDCTRCFMCGIGLRSWSIGDDPWVEHARWSSKCHFVLIQKGQSYINTVRLAVSYQEQLGNDDIVQTPRIAQYSMSEDRRDSTNDIVTALMRQAQVQSVLDMGFEVNLVRNAVLNVLQTQGRDAVTAENLIEKVFELKAKNEDESQQKDKEAKEALTSVQTAAMGTNSVNTVSKRDRRRQISDLQLENEMLKNQSICSNCHVNEVSIVYLPCGHLITCDKCAPSIKHCQMKGCGKYILGTVRTYRS